MDEPEEGIDLSEGDSHDASAYVPMPGMPADLQGEMPPPPSHMTMGAVSREHMDPHHMQAMPPGIVATGAEYQ